MNFVIEKAGGKKVKTALTTPKIVLGTKAPAFTLENLATGVKIVVQP